jgi:hypothetical protein
MSGQLGRQMGNGFNRSAYIIIPIGEGQSVLCRSKIGQTVSCRTKKGHTGVCRTKRTDGIMQDQKRTGGSMLDQLIRQD